MAYLHKTLMLWQGGESWVSHRATFFSRSIRSTSVQRRIQRKHSIKHNTVYFHSYANSHEIISEKAALRNKLFRSTSISALTPRASGVNIHPGNKLLPGYLCFKEKAVNTSQTVMVPASVSKSELKKASRIQISSKAQALCSHQGLDFVCAWAKRAKIQYESHLDNFLGS